MREYVKIPKKGNGRNDGIEPSFRPFLSNSISFNTIGYIQRDTPYNFSYLQPPCLNGIIIFVSDPEFNDPQLLDIPGFAIIRNL